MTVITPDVSGPLTEELLKTLQQIQAAYKATNLSIDELSVDIDKGPNRITGDPETKIHFHISTFPHSQPEANNQ